MDRFIGIQLLNFRYIDADLKSNMDRFIGVKNAFDRQNEFEFKIQYG